MIDGNQITQIERLDFLSPSKKLNHGGVIKMRVSLITKKEGMFSGQTFNLQIETYLNKNEIHYIDKKNSTQFFEFGGNLVSKYRGDKSKKGGIKIIFKVLKNIQSDVES